MRLSAARRAKAREWKSGPPRDRGRPLMTPCDAAWTVREVQAAVRRWLQFDVTPTYATQLPGQVATFRREERRIDGVLVDAVVDGDNARTVYACAPRR